MSAGTIKLTNGSNAVVGTGTAFTSDLKSGDVITATVGGIFFTLFVDAVTSNTALTLTDPFTGPTTSALAWVAVPQLTLNRITAALAAQTAESVRRVLQENANWQAFYSGTGDITVTLPDGSPAGRPLAGPSWAKMSGLVNSAVQWRGRPASTENINTYGPTSAYVGQWGFSASGALMSNGFPEDGAQGILEVFQGGTWNGSQRFISKSGNQYYRTLTAAWNGTNGPWSAWISTGLPLRGDLSTTDLNAITGENEGIHFQSRNGNATAARNYPVNIAGSLRVYKTAANNTKSCIQYYDAWDRDIAYRRTGVSDASGVVSWSVWSLVGTSGANKALNDLGLGLNAVPTLASFDWQQADLLSGAIYYVSSTNVTNMPAGVTYNAGTGLYILVRGNTQSGNRNSVQVIPDTVANSNYREYVILSTGAKGSRTFYVRQLFSSADTIPIANGGTGAITADNARKSLNFMGADLTVSDAGTPAIPTGAFFLGDGQTGGGNGKPFNYSTILQLSEGGVNPTGNWSQIAVPVGAEGAPRFRTRMNTPRLTNWYEFMVKGLNATVDSNGFYKTSSPVVKIHANGDCEVNGEAEGCSVQRLATGEYLIEGCNGLNADAAWGGIDGGFEIPLDRNKQPRIWLDYEVNPDGSVLVKTYHRTHPNAPEFARNLIGVKNDDGIFTETVKNGEPVDVPADTFISVRVEMPLDSIWNQRQLEAAAAMAEVAQDEQPDIQQQ